MNDEIKKGEDFAEAILRVADFAEATLRVADFAEATLRVADFAEATLRVADFAEAILRVAHEKHIKEIALIASLVTAISIVCEPLDASDKDIVLRAIIQEFKRIKQ